MKKIIISIVILCSTFVSTLSWADYRDFPYSYQARTLPKSGLEFEYYIDSSLPDIDDQSNYNWRQQFEIEYGLTDKLSLALYQSFRTTSFDLTSTTKEYRTTFDSVKFQSKYRFFAPGEWFVDPMIYVEYVMDTSFEGHTDKVEIKEIFAKDIDKFHTALNLTEEYAFDGEFELNYDAGVGVDLTSWMLFGAQVKGQFIEDVKLSAGPALTLRAPRVYISFGALFGVDDKSNDIDARALVGITL